MLVLLENETNIKEGGGRIERDGIGRTYHGPRSEPSAKRAEVDMIASVFCTRPISDHHTFPECICVHRDCWGLYGLMDNNGHAPVIRRAREVRVEPVGSAMALPLPQSECPTT